MRLIHMAIAVAFAMMITVSAVNPARAQSGGSAQQAVRMFYFYSETCSHCQAVSAEVLPPLRQKYGDRLQIREFEFDPVPNYQVMVKLEKQAGVEGGGVPEIFVGKDVLIGEDEIRNKLPELVESYAAAGGTEWPSQDLPVAPNPSTAAQAKSSTSGFALAWAVMAGMAVAVVYAGLALARSFQGVLPRDLPGWLEFGVPILAVAGLAVSFYLSYVETQSVRAICGPVGDCNAVQSSKYAKLFGVPVGVIGLAGYLAILGAWVWGRLRSDGLAAYMPLALFGMSLFGVVFSVYLTYLELFVIKAICIWCLSQAVIMTLLLVLTVGPALQMMAIGEAGEDEPLGGRV